VSGLVRYEFHEIDDELSGEVKKRGQCCIRVRVSDSSLASSKHLLLVQLLVGLKLVS
jgi:hypothetical protein